jgi:hypothetical protein
VILENSPMLNTIALPGRMAAAHDQEQLTASRKGRVKRILARKGRKEKGKKEPRFCPFFPHADWSEPTLNLALGSAGLLLLA